MIGYVSVGADDLALAQRFYSAFLPHLGYGLTVSSEGLSYSVPATDDGAFLPPDFYVKPPFDGKPASAGNGAMVAFEVPTQAMVRELHADALAAGGHNEGAPGFRADYSAHFYVGYLRDPQGNKIALYCSSRSEPGRPD
ncbi:VOC family protein [Hoeflea sp.]|uniref:VOC family protein n=1 Tax=Hoeflea sp. TaxID=1940281 RepID=UPI003B51D9CE